MVSTEHVGPLDIEREIRRAVQAHPCREELRDCLDGVASEVAQARVEAHIVGCLVCQARYFELKCEGAMNPGSMNQERPAG